VLYRFGTSELDTAMFELRVDGERVPIEPQVFEVLAHLVEHRDRLVPRTELLDAVWGDRFVSDGALSSRIAAARQALGDDGRTQKYIRTVHGRGIQFIAEVEQVDMVDAPRPTVDRGELRQTVRFVPTTNDLQLAVATVGSGRTLVKAANWLTHVEQDWRSPVWHHWLAEFGDRFEFVRYDSRGCGLSDWDLTNSDMSDLDQWTADLEAVVDTLDAEQFALFGMSQGGAPAIAYAVRHPERVSHLILFGAYSRGMWLRDAQSKLESQALLELMRVGWGGTNPAFRSVFTLTFMPDATSDHVRWFNDLQVQTTNAENAVALEEAFYSLDVSDIATQVTVPTLVLHSRHDASVPFAEGRRLASLIPGAELVTLESNNHILTSDEPAWAEFLDHIDRFIT
jgi:pimeloyl-ACP methyl ester carboxylesterase